MRCPWPCVVALCASLQTSSAHAAPVIDDRGIWPELGAAVELELAAMAPAVITGERGLLVDERHGLATLYAGADPRKVYRWPLSSEDRAELARIAPVEKKGAPTHEEDHDGDGIVDRLDILRGGKKLLANRAAYHERYVRLPYPGGDVPRTEGVCTDTIVRALRNAGIDLQAAVHDDIVAARKAYPMVDKLDPSINHRRVKTILVWFKRHFRALPPDRDFQPGDVVFLDTFPTRAGAEHVGLVSDRAAPDGRPLVINNWTDGAVDAEMPLLGVIPVTDHFRASSGR